MPQGPNDKPKLIIDEDWKTQVEREREEAKRAKEQSEASAAAAASPNTGAVSDSEIQSSGAPSANMSATGMDEGEAPPPPANFQALVSMLGTQALVAMGQLGEDTSAPPHMGYAKHFIDLLAVVEEKSKGNLSAEEIDLLADWLHQLRMGFVEVSKHLK